MHFRLDCLKKGILRYLLFISSNQSMSLLTTDLSQAKKLTMHYPREKCIMHHAKDITSHKPQSTGQLLVRIEFRDLQIILPL